MDPRPAASFSTARRARRLVLSLVQDICRTAGLKLEFDHPVRNIPKLLRIKAAEHGIKTILDVGANKGQFAVELRRCGYTGAIISFEPLASVYPLLERAAARDPSWLIAPRMALGDVPGLGRIQVAKNLASSSLLPVLEKSVMAAAHTECAGTEDVPIHRLDDTREATWRPPFGLKLDTQGFELQVLRGASGVLADTKVVVAELSLTELYQGGTRFNDIYGYLEQQGFGCISLVQGFSDHATHELLQVDGLFVRRPPKS